MSLRMSHANTPVIVGVSQILQRISDPLEGKEPLYLMLDAVRQAAEDTGNPGMTSEIESIRVVRGIWRYKNPAKFIADQLGLGEIETVGTPFGGNMVQSLVNQTALEILDGTKSVVVITGAETGNSQAKARKAGIKLPATEVGGTYTRMAAEEKPMAAEAEMSRGIRAPIQVYPIFENAIRHSLGESIPAHIKRVSELWAGFSQVASHNPSAWITEAVDAETIRTASERNRMISFPYPKLMNSNSAVDMSAALILCSVEKARQLNIPESQWVYPWAGTDAHDHYFVSNRADLHSSPAIRIGGARVLELAGLNVADIDSVDVYSCFPSAVQIAAMELKLDLSKPLTVTGGLTFGGGPMNNYVTHSIARMVEVLRLAPGSKGLITANGGYLTKHAFGIYSTEAPPKNFVHQDVQAEVDVLPFREAVVAHRGEVSIESYTVMFGENGPTMGHAACLLPDGRRSWGNISDRDVLKEMTVEEFCGRRAVLNTDGELTVTA